MKLGISTACFYPESLESTFSQIAQLGFKHIEVFFNTESEFHMPLLGKIKDIIKSYNLEVISVHPYTSLMEGMLLFSEYERRTKDGLNQYRRYFETANILGAKYFTLHGERKIVGMPDETPESWKRKIESYHKLCLIASEYNIKIAQENVAWCQSAKPEYLKVLYDNVPELGYTFDIKQSFRAGHSWNEYYEIMSDRLFNIHINDYDENHSCMLPGRGSFDYNEFFKRLNKDKYNGDVLIEVYKTNFNDINELKQSAVYLQNIIEKL